jgi:hypothetical protein
LGGWLVKKKFSKIKNGQVMNKKNLFLAITFEPLDQKFSKLGILDIFMSRLSLNGQNSLNFFSL